MGRAIAAFLQDLAAGDPVAIGLVIGFLIFLGLFGLVSLLVIWNRKHAEEAHKKKLREKYGYGAKPVKPIKKSKSSDEL